jgi:hypothetical protein
VREGVGSQVVLHYVAAGVGSLQLLDNTVGKLDAGRSPFAWARNDIQDIHNKKFGLKAGEMQVEVAAPAWMLTARQMYIHFMYRHCSADTEY